MNLSTPPHPPQVIIACSPSDNLNFSIILPSFRFCAVVDLVQHVSWQLKPKPCDGSERGDNAGKEAYN